MPPRLAHIHSSLRALLLAPFLGAFLPALAAPDPVPPVSWVEVGDPEFPSLLAVPDHCLLTECALIVVSHPRAQTPDRLRRSPGFTHLRDALLGGRFAMLLSSDGGPTTWGSPHGLRQVGRAHQQARKMFLWNGRTYALGLSMGGLMALRSTLPGSPYPVSGLALIDPWVNLSAAWKSAASRREEIRDAYGPDTDLSAVKTHDPLPLALTRPPAPVIIASSADDTVVSTTENADRLARHAAAPYNQHIRLTGPHLGGNRFTPQMGAALLHFFQDLEDRP